MSAVVVFGVGGFLTVIAAVLLNSWLLFFIGTTCMLIGYLLAEQGR